MSYFTKLIAWRVSCLLLLLISGIHQANSQVNLSYQLGTRQQLPPDWFGFDGQNVIRSASWVDTNLMKNVPLLKPKFIRYPSTFAFWDWKEGWFINSPLLPNKYTLLP